MFSTVLWECLSAMYKLFSECQVNSDIVFAIDSTNPSLRNEILSMVKSVISGIYVDSTAASLAVVSYGSDAIVQIALATITDENQINSALDRIQFFSKDVVLFWY